ncbi:MAG: NADH-quinone oxidoreductase subunit F [Gammaproteobacteria bacterium]|nr:MAG: NADH-quinone oxidoreductase subunit F [Gammaproteobacteria bacterium]
MSEHSQKTERRQHPGARRGRARATPKGRQVEPAARDAIRALLENRPRQRDLLIEYLHLIQDRYGELSAAHLAALAEEMRLSMSEVYEVATFYAHFHVVADAHASAPVTIRVCDSLSCELSGAQALLGALAEAADPERVRVVRAPCMGRCDTAPVAEVGHHHVDHASVETVMAAANAGRVHPEIPDYEDYAAYVKDGGYQLLKSCLDGTVKLDDVIETLDESGLRGLGGAGFPTGRKWRIVRGYEGPRLMAVNADEGEVGTFKDRYYLERSPHRFLEGVLIAVWAVEAQAVYIYLRDEYPAVREILLKEIAALREAGLTAHTQVHLRRGAGAYICGEESSMIESIEGKRGLPRHRPPYVAEVGLFGRPTLVQNVETMYWVRDIVEKGAEWFASHGRNGGKGLRSYSVSGRVREPGVKLAPAGITARELIEEFSGGMLEGHTFKGYLPGGASGGILPASMADLPLEFGSLEKHGCFVGSHAVVILSDKDSMKDAALNLMRFFEDESCGQCTPCRIGTEKAVALMSRPQWDAPLLLEVGRVMADASICGLGQAAANPLKSVLEFFPEEHS